MKSKKLISLLAVLAMCMGLISVPAMAEENVVNVSSQAELQAALDNFTAGTTIQLAENKDYGLVYLRPIEENTSTTTKVTFNRAENYGNNHFLSVFENMTIKGATGATVGAIKIEAGIYIDYQGSIHSQTAKYSQMRSAVELKNVVIDGVTFTGDNGSDGKTSILNLDNSIKVDGLTVKNCTVNDETGQVKLIHRTVNPNEEATYTLKNSEDPTEYTIRYSLDNITVKDCTFNGGYQFIELKPTNNLTIEGNTINNTAMHNILLSASGGQYSGIIKIVGNTSDGAKERFIRATAMGDANVIVEDNKIIDYKGADNDFVKFDGVTDGSPYSIKNNTYDGRDTELTVTSGMYQLFATDWTTDTDAGYYTANDTDYGMMRYLFKVETDDYVTAYGIKYIKTSATLDGVTIEDAETGEAVEKSGNVKVFHGDIVGIPQGTSTDGSYYAVGYVTTASGTMWSPIKSNKINWLRKFTDYTPGGDK
ncbi:MAG: hypothetical protein IJT23_05680 [Clostridia bacterium]|nr:hypothetical protein [Clostridia bacterium]